MKGLKFISLFLFVLAAILIFKGFKAFRTPIFENNPNIAYTTGTITKNSYDPNVSGMKVVYSDDSVTLLKPGTSYVEFKTPEGVQVSGSLMYCLGKLPDDNKVRIAYDTKNLFRFGVAGYDSNDIFTAIFLWCFAGLSALFGLFTAVAALVLKLTEAKAV